MMRVLMLVARDSRACARCFAADGWDEVVSERGEGTETRNSKLDFLRAVGWM
jgi:hypothetical protein